MSTQWRGMIRLASISAIVVACLIPLQAAVFLLSPPPSTVLGFFDLFQRNPGLGLLDLDLLLTLDYLVMLPLYLALYLIIRHRAPSAALLAVLLGLFSVLLFLVTREATFSMWILSDQYQHADPTQQAALLASGQSLLTWYNGGTFGLSYVLGAISTLLFSAALLRHRIFGRAPGVVGLITGVTMLVPANVGMVGLVVAMLSLIPTMLWLILLARAFHRQLAET
ncbi:DUF4386 family protein [Granulicoccus phenolivorans]|uniref:DUF4386 family protein n=1 Tax=Granulicoccus phenolivorans TaxID=266854 RepID=UPI0009DB9EFA|nr:DUF4386 family protein [Granulicoccus phenolivorans]